MRRNLADVQFSDIQQLVVDRASEGQTLDFKRDLPDRSDRSKLEFLKDVCAMANSSGGDLVYGISDLEGSADSISLIQGESPEAAILRLGQVADAGLEPRIVGLQMKALIEPSGFVLVVRVPRSLVGPHRVVAQNHSKFFLRNMMHTSEMTYAQLRAAFGQVDALISRATAFKETRLSVIAARKTPRPMLTGPIAVAMLVPLQSMEAHVGVDVRSIDYGRLRLPSWTGFADARNLDGLLGYSEIRDQGTWAYCQLFRNGALESTRIARRMVDELPYIPAEIIADFYRDALPQYSALARDLNLSGPAVFSCSLLNTNGFHFLVGSRGGSQRISADRNHIHLPDVWIEDLTLDLEVDAFIRPILEILWEAFDLRRCSQYDQQGNWIKPHY